MKIDITIEGRGGHASRPDQSINPLDCFTAVFAGLAQLGGQMKVEQVDCGNSTNVIVDTLRFRLVCREEDVSGVKMLADNLCAGYQCAAEYKIIQQE